MLPVCLCLLRPLTLPLFPSYCPFTFVINSLCGWVPVSHPSSGQSQHKTNTQTKYHFIDSHSLSSLSGCLIVMPGVFVCCWIKPGKMECFIRVCQIRVQAHVEVCGGAFHTLMVLQQACSCKVLRVEERKIWILLFGLNRVFTGKPSFCRYF